MDSPEPSQHTPTRDDIETPARPAPPEGAPSLFIGRYRILGRLGAGGMGTVYRAFDPPLQRVVALKVPRFDTNPDDLAGVVQRFLREARSAAKIRHAHVCPIHDVGEHEGRPYVVMAYIEGKSLSEKLSGGHRYDDPDEAVRLVRQVADALGAVHAHGLVHRDLKPANILLDRDGHAILTDFGLARCEHDAERLTVDGAVVGTPAFMSPEQAMGQSDRVGPRSDLYSLGVVLYRMLTGRVPFTGPTGEVLRKLGHEDPPPPSSLRPDLDPALEAILLKALARSPEDRYASAREMSAALDHWLTRAVAAPAADSLADVTPVESPADRAAPPPSVDLPLTRLGISTVTTQVAFPSRGDTPARAKTPFPPRTRALSVAAAAVSFLLGGALIALLVTYFPGGEPARPNDKGNGRHPGRLVIHPELFDGKAGDPLSPMALVTRPAAVAGTRAWTVETRDPRGPVRALAHSRDGTRLAAAGDDGTVRVWDAATRRLLRVLIGHARPVRGLAWSPDDRYLASGGADATVRLWDPATGRLLRTLTGHTGAVRAVAWSPDGATLASGSQDTTARLWETATGQPKGLPLDHPERAEVLTLAWSPDGKALATAGRDKLVRLWDTATRRPLRTAQEHDFPLVHALAWSPDGKTLASAGQEGVRLWDAVEGKPRAPILPGVPVLAVAWAPGGDRLATATRDTVQTWESSGRPLRTLERHDGDIQALSWSTDRRALASAGADGTVRFWNADTGAPAGLIEGHPAGAAAVAWAPGGKELAVGGFTDRRLRLWQTEAATVQLLDGKCGPVVAWSHDGKTLAGTHGKTVLRWDAARRQGLASLGAHDEEVTSLAWAPGDLLLASGSADDTARLWEVAAAKPPRKLQPRAFNVFAVAWSPNRTTLAVGATREAQLWELGRERPTHVLDGHAGSVRAVAWAPDGGLLATAEGDGEGLIFLWKPATGEQRSRLAGHKGGVGGLAWSVDCKTLASAGADGRIRLWPVEGNRPSAELGAHGGAVHSLAWSAASGTLASAGKDGTVRLWKASPARPGPVLVPLRAGGGVLVTPEGHWAGPPETAAELVYVVRTESGQDILSPADFAAAQRWQNDPARARVADR